MTSSIHSLQPSLIPELVRTLSILSIAYLALRRRTACRHFRKHACGYGNGSNFPASCSFAPRAHMSLVLRARRKPTNPHSHSPFPISTPNHKCFISSHETFGRRASGLKLHDTETYMRAERLNLPRATRDRAPFEASPEGWLSLSFTGNTAEGFGAYLDR